MSDASGFYEHLTFNTPLSGVRADALSSRLIAATPTTLLDVGCGWGELLIRVAERCPGASALAWTPRNDTSNAGEPGPGTGCLGEGDVREPARW